MQYAYVVFFIISVVFLVVLVSRYRNKVSVYYLMLLIAVMMTNLGYMEMVFSINLEEAILANQVSYLGGCFSPFFLVMCIADLIKYKISRVMSYIGFGTASILFASVLTIGKWPIYYESVALGRNNGISYLIKTYGPMHHVYIVYIFTMSLVGIVLSIKAFKNRKRVSYLNSSLLLACMMVTVFCYLFERLLGLEYDFLPLAYLLSSGGILVLLRRISLYEVSAISVNAMSKNDTYGFLLFDSKGRYLGCDGAATKWFPEVDELMVDRVVDKGESEFLNHIYHCLETDDPDEVIYIDREKWIIEVRHSILKTRRWNSIHCFYLRDDTKQQQFTNLVKRYNENLERDVNEKTRKIREIQNDIIISMASIVENRDGDTGGHIARTSDIVRIFVKHLMENILIKDMTPNLGRNVIKAAPLHDFGKIAIPDLILNKPGKFTDEEYAIMKQHSAKGAVIVERILQNSDDEEFKRTAVNVAHYHHEKWDGKGYPEGISGEDIPFEARIMALADVFDALVSKRIYKDSYGYDRAFEIIEQSGGSHFDPILCREFIKCRPQLEALYNSYGD